MKKDPLSFLPMKLPIVHHPDYDARFPATHRFPMGKYTALYEELEARGFLTDQNLFKPAPAGSAWLTMAHEATYVDSVLNCTVLPSIEREIGFPVDERVSRRARLATAGTLLAARLALSGGTACNMAGGSHHARREQGAGYCTFNDVGVAASVLLADGEVGSVLVVDLDVHQGDGTARIFRNDARVFTFSMHCEKNYPVRKAASDLDVGLAEGTSGQDYISTLAEILETLAGRLRPDIVFYNAGVDVHRGDRLGKLALDDADISTRDRLVFGHFRERNIPVCGVIGGGYSTSVGDIARRHAFLFEAAAEFC